jgi:hypothetical protein
MSALSSPVLKIKRSAPAIASVPTDFTAPDERPASLPPATLKALADAKARNEYLEGVNCYWSPPETDELINFTNAYNPASIRDFRIRHSQLNVYDLPNKEARLVELNAISPALAKASSDARMAVSQTESRLRTERNLGYFDIRNQPEFIEATTLYKKAEANVKRNQEDITYYKSLIAATKEWKPVRRIVVSFTANDHTTAKTIADIEANKDKYPTLFPKLVAVINFRKAAMEQMNKQRSNPMRNIYINIVLTPMDFKADCSWTIHRSDSDWNYCTHYLHTTEYNLAGAEAVEYKSREQMMTEAEKAEEEAKKQRLHALKKTPYDNYFIMNEYTLNENTSIKTKESNGMTTHTKTINVNDLVQPDDLEEVENFKGEKYMRFKYCVIYFVIGNVDIEANTFDVLGYFAGNSDADKVLKKCREVKHITNFEPKTKRAKYSPLQKKIEKQNLTQNYEIDILFSN